MSRSARGDAERSDGKGSARGSEEEDGGAQSPQSQQSPAKDSAAEAEEAAAAAEKEKAEKEKAEREKAEKEKAEKEKAAVRRHPLLCTSTCSCSADRFCDRGGCVLCLVPHPADVGCEAAGCGQS